MAHEEWRDVVGYEGYYQVSNLGRVRSVDREFVNRVGYHRVLRGKILKQVFNNKYYRVHLSKDNHAVCKIVHRLVAEAFIPRIEGKDYVDHINADTKDNRAENLRWVTMAENNQHIHELGHFNKELASQRMRERNAKNGTPIPPKRVIRNDGVVFDSICAAAKASGAWMGNVSKVAHGLISQPNGYSFRFIEQESQEGFNHD
jgi:hypothetical protein